MTAEDEAAPETLRALSPMAAPAPAHEDAFPETVVHMHLDGASRKYVPVDGDELKGLIADARRKSFVEVIAILEDERSRHFVNTVDYNAVSECMRLVAERLLEHERDILEHERETET